MRTEPFLLKCGSFGAILTLLLGVDVLCRISYLFVNCSYVTFCRLVNSFFCYRLLVIKWFLFGGVSSTSW